MSSRGTRQVPRPRCGTRCRVALAASARCRPPAGSRPYRAHACGVHGAASALGRSAGPARRVRPTGPVLVTSSAEYRRLAAESAPGTGVEPGNHRAVRPAARGRPAPGWIGAAPRTRSRGRAP